MSASAHRYSCDQLGACQSRTTPCSGCTQQPKQHPFAPGAIEHHRRPFGTPAQRRELWAWLVAGSVVCGLVFGLALAAGIVTTLAGARA
jgi:hypothetical protein